MTTSLILDSLEVRHFRAFRHLRIERLGRVNLIVGKNNVGKSCLLEALWLYAERGSSSSIWELLEARDETTLIPILSEIEPGDQVLALKYLFYGRKDIEKPTDPIQIGPIDSSENTLSIAVNWFAEQSNGGGSVELQPLRPEEYNKVANPVLGLIIQMGRSKVIYRLDRWSYRYRQPRPFDHRREISYSFIPANGLSREKIGRLWDGAILKNLREDTLTSLRIIAPKVESVDLITSQEVGQDLRTPVRPAIRIPIVKISGLDYPIPLRNFGEGMSRLFGVALALVNAKDGLLLIDEVESGLHYSVQPDLWRLIFEVAHRLNVQVFATTHSWDCIKAFQMAAQEDETEEGVLISLRRKQGREDEIVAVLFNEEELNIVAPAQIEVR